jgi:ABC-type glutathione transport system ATPase component
VSVGGTTARASESLDVSHGETLDLWGVRFGQDDHRSRVLGLVKPSGGEIAFDGEVITHLSARDRRRLAKDIQVVFQDPYTSLNPSLTVERHPRRAPRGAPSRAKARDARTRVRTLLDQVGLPADAAERLPRKFSGGQRQRVVIARALAPKPKLIVCDEPVSALDLSTQERMLDLFIDIQRSTGVAHLFVSHDLSVVRHIGHRVAVLYRGDFVETGSAAQVTSAPEHAYSQQLLLAAPVADPIGSEPAGKHVGNL